MKFNKQNQLVDNGIYSLMQWSQFSNIKITIYHDIYIEVLSDETVPYLTVSTDDVINTTNNDTKFPDLRRYFEELFEMKFQEGSVLVFPVLSWCQC